MNKQYLKSLQERAQRLLEMSSEQGSDQQNFTQSKTKSRRVNLNEVLSGTDINQINTQFEEYRNTDVQLLKKCINMTNQNSQLKRQLKSYQTENSQLKAQISFLEKDLDNFKLQLTKMKQRQRTKVNGNESPYNKLQDNEQFSFIGKNQFQGLKQKSQSVYKFSSKYSQANQEVSNPRQIQKINQIHEKKILELEQRLKAANLKRQNIEQTLMKQKQKSLKLWTFINRQIPQLKDVITNLTNKVDVQVESILLKSIDQNQNQMNYKVKNNRLSKRAF